MLALFAQAEAPKTEVQINGQQVDQMKAMTEFFEKMGKDPLVLGSGGLMSVLLLVSLVCLLWVIVAMFKNDAKGLGIVTILTTLFCGIGPLIAFLFGWLKSGEWKIKGVMTVWTLSILGYAASFGYLYYQLHLFTQELQKLQTKG